MQHTCCRWENSRIPARKSTPTKGLDANRSRRRKTDLSVAYRRAWVDDATQDVSSNACEGVNGNKFLLPQYILHLFRACRIAVRTTIRKARKIRGVRRTFSHANPQQKKTAINVLQIRGACATRPASSKCFRHFHRKHPITPLPHHWTNAAERHAVHRQVRKGAVKHDRCEEAVPLSLLGDCWR